MDHTGEVMTARCGIARKGGSGEPGTVQGKRVSGEVGARPGRKEIRRFRVTHATGLHAWSPPTARWANPRLETLARTHAGYCRATQGDLWSHAYLPTPRPTVSGSGWGRPRSGMGRKSAPT